MIDFRTMADKVAKLLVLIVYYLYYTRIIDL